MNTQLPLIPPGLVLRDVEIPPPDPLPIEHSSPPIKGPDAGDLERAIAIVAADTAHCLPA